jgi:hypothetical protein
VYGNKMLSGSRMLDILKIREEAKAKGRPARPPM